MGVAGSGVDGDGRQIVLADSVEDQPVRPAPVAYEVANGPWWRTDGPCHTDGMTVTTIKVASSTRDRILALARSRGETMDQALVRLLDVAERDLTFERISRDMAANPPDDRYAEEVAYWSEGQWD